MYPCLSNCKAPCSTTNALQGGRTSSGHVAGTGGAAKEERGEDGRMTRDKTRTPSTDPLGRNIRLPRVQNSSFSTFAGNALTTVFAGFAFTMTVLPKTSLLPAFVAGFLRVFNMTRPGITNLAFFFTSAVAMLASVSNIFFASAGLISHASAMLLAKAPLDMTVPVFIPFILGAIAARVVTMRRGRDR